MIAIEDIEELLKRLVIPDNTKIEENNILADTDVLIGSYADIGYGILAKSVIAGERTNIAGDVIADGDVRMDLWSNIEGDVNAKMDAYLGESVKIHGKLTVYGDLDIGNDVMIEEGFEAKGWIAIRNPIPVIVYIMLYLAELLRLGRSEEVEKFLDELFEEDEFKISDSSMVIPSRAKINYEAIQFSGKGTIGNNCRLVGNFKSSSLRVGENTTLFGSIRTKDEIYVGKNSIIHGDLISRGGVFVDEGAHILGKIKAGHVDIHKDAAVDGPMSASNGVRILRDEEEEKDNKQD
ncbi:MAG: polymer-forming cytoskeletal protein [Halobacteriota archaeon]|nr:polymer-forming cytoskeletal protein [Halobacteriota archaeon]